jgi:2-polyprenyl-3-methyl-5-hydroxy-6-metoxy-1,4-benzoquinol methylase
MNEAQRDPSEVLAPYRQRVYERYATHWRDGVQTVDAARLQAHAKAYRYYFRGWLPRAPDSAIVDIGCGRGLLLAFLKACGYHSVQGIDVSPEQVALARRMAMEVQQGDAIAFLARCPNAYDLLTCVDLIEHFQKPEVMRFLDTAYEALKPGGRLVLQTPNADSPWGSMHRYNDFTHEVGFNPNALSRLLRLAGFTDMEAREAGPVPWGYSITSSVRYLAWRTIRAGLTLWNLVETGSRGSGVLTRIFLMSARKP